MRLIVVFIFLAFALSASANRARCRGALSTQETFYKHLELVHELKGTFESLFPVEPESIAFQFPDAYQRIRSLFFDRPSHLSAINLEKLTRAGIKMDWIFRDIREFAWRIGDDLEKISKDYIVRRNVEAGPTQKDVEEARRIVGLYVNKFKVKQTGLERSTTFYDDYDGEHFRKIVAYGDSVVNAVWSELRLSLLIGRLAEAQVTVSKLIKDHKLPSDMKGKVSQKVLDQEIDHLWFPYGEFKETAKPTPQEFDFRWGKEPKERAHYIALGDTKSLMKPLSEDYWRWDDLLEQLDRYLTIASFAGHYFSLQPRVYYFFIAGITPSARMKMLRAAEAFNRSLAQRGLLHQQAPVGLLVYGLY